MDNMNLNKHISGQFNTELEAVRNNVLAMGGLVEQQLSDALVAIHDQDLELARRIVEHWIFWIVVNCVSVYLYYLRGLYPTMFLYICYAILAAAGLYTWKKKGIRTNDSTL